MSREPLQLADALGKDHAGCSIRIVLGALTLGDFFALQEIMAERHPSIRLEWLPAGYLQERPA